MMSKRKRQQLNYDYTPLSDPSIVTALIENRISVKCECDDALLTYIDLDALIDKTKLSVNQRRTIMLIMEGYSISDIAEYLGGQRQRYNVFYARAVNKLCKQAAASWEQFYGQRPAKGFCY